MGRCVLLDIFSIKASSGVGCYNKEDTQLYYQCNIAKHGVDYNLMYVEKWNLQSYLCQ